MMIIDQLVDKKGSEMARQLFDCCCLMVPALMSISLYGDDLTSNYCDVK